MPASGLLASGLVGAAPDSLPQRRSDRRASASSLPADPTGCSRPWRRVRPGASPRGTGRRCTRDGPSSSIGGRGGWYRRSGGRPVSPRTIWPSSRSRPARSTSDRAAISSVRVRQRSASRSVARFDGALLLLERDEVSRSRSSASEVSRSSPRASDGRSWPSGGAGAAMPCETSGSARTRGSEACARDQRSATLARRRRCRRPRRRRMRRPARAASGPARRAPRDAPAGRRRSRSTSARSARSNHGPPSIEVTVRAAALGDEPGRGDVPGGQPALLDASRRSDRSRRTRGQAPPTPCCAGCGSPCGPSARARRRPGR